MTADEIALLFWGLPIAILGLGMRHRLRVPAYMTVLAIGILLPLWLGAGGHALQWMRDGTAVSLATRLRVEGPFLAGAALLGGLIGLMIRDRPRGTP